MAVCTMRLIWSAILLLVVRTVADESPLKATTTDSQYRPEITSSGLHYDQSPRRENFIAKRAATQSICGYVTSDIHWPWYCNPGQFCDVGGPYLRCCNSMSTTGRASNQVNTVTVTDRNTRTFTSLQTYFGSMFSYVYDDCAVQSRCFNSADAGKCTGSCNSTALLCTDQYFPYCASVYYVGSNSTSGMGFMCDTTSWGMTMNGYGYWPSSTVTSTSTRTVNTTSTSSAPTWTPNPVPFSRTQVWRPQQALITVTATSTSQAVPMLVQPIFLVWMATLVSLLFQSI